MSQSKLLQTVIQIKDTLPKKQRLFCEYILDNYMDMEIDSINRMADKAGIGTTTILRTIKHFGYDSFSDFKYALQQSRLLNHAPKWYALEEADEGDESNIKKTWKKVSMLLEYSFNENLEREVEEAVSLFLKVRQINVFGLRTSKSVATYFENTINQFNQKVLQLSHEPYFVLDRLYHSNAKDVLVLIALSEYSTMTYRVAEYAVEHDIPIVLITDRSDNTIVPLAKHVLFLGNDESHYTIVHAIALVETLAVAMANALGDSAKNDLLEIGHLLARKNVTRL